jgi:transcription initiation factor TFIIIB Brf1 subunit/transcription initiation factor TFIIB
MLTKLVKKYGVGKSVDAYINFAALELDLRESTVRKAHELYKKAKPQNYDQSASMLALALIYISARLANEYIHYRKWSKVCSYNTLIAHVKRANMALNEASITH